MNVRSKEIRKLVQSAKKQGWTASFTKGGHIRLASPTGALVIAPSTPSDWRTTRNIIRELRKFGFIEVKK